MGMLYCFTVYKWLNGKCDMATITFDTLKFANTLKDLATKEDLHREIESLRRDFDARFIQTEQRLVIKLGSLMTLSIGIVAALVKLL